MWWDWLIAILIILSLILVVWAKASHQTIPELIGGIFDIINEKKEDISDSEIAYYVNK